MNKLRSVYIHLPFCKTICSYCDFCKIIYNKKYIDNYLGALEQEITTYYEGDVIKTIYIGGGTPSCLELEDLNKLLKIIKNFKVTTDLEFTVELNIEHINEEMLKLLYDHQVNRLSIGVQTFNQKHLKVLKRSHCGTEVKEKIALAKRVGFNNISIDLMYALPNQTKKELREDLEMFLKLDLNHLSLYSLIIEPRTVLYINKVNKIDEDLDYEMDQLINQVLIKKGYQQYEISNYSEPGYESKHNLQYWNNLEYYGFGMGASGYINGIRYTNVLNINKYINLYFRAQEERVSDKERMENEFLLGLRKRKGINKKDFFEKYNVSITEKSIVQKLIKERKLIDDNINIYVNDKYLYLLNEILIDFMG